MAQKSEIKAKIYGDHSSLSMSAYIQAQQRFGKSITLNTGARMETYSVDNKKLDESLAPQVALNFRLFDWLSLRGSVSKGFRVPTVAEMYTKTQLNIFQVMPNPDLKSESSWSREIGLTAQLPGNQWASDLKFDLATFSSTFKRLIEVSLNETGIVQFHNLTDAIISGVELGLSGAMLNRSILFSTAYTQLNPREIDNNRKTLDTLAYRFRHTLVSSLGTRFFGLTAMVENRYMSRMEKVVLFQENPISGEDKRVPIHIWNASLGYEYRDWNFLFRIENMFQYYYTELERNMGDERHFSLMLSKKI